MKRRRVGNTGAEFMAAIVDARRALQDAGIELRVSDWLEAEPTEEEEIAAAIPPDLRERMETAEKSRR